MKQIKWAAFLAFCCAHGVVTISAETSYHFEIVERLKAIKLTGEQQAEVNLLVQEYGPRVQRAEQDAARTDAQRQAQQAAIKRAIAAGKRGAEAAELIGNAGKQTKSQKEAAFVAAQLIREFNAQIRSLLTQRQQMQLDTAFTPADRSGVIVFRLSPDLPEPSKAAKKFYDVARELRLGEIVKVLTKYNLDEPLRLILMMPIDEEKEASEEKQKLLRRLRSYWYIDTRDQVDQIEQIVADFNRLNSVDTAYEQWTFGEPSVHPANDQYSPRQEYLDPAPRGIDAHFAWSHPHGAGAGIGLIDVERGWHEEHEDFTSKPQQVFGDQRPASRRHGAAVLGEVIADDNEIGVVGIAPSASYVFMTSYYNARTNNDGSVATAITDVMPMIHPGDVLLLEVHTKVNIGGKKVFMPAEVDDTVFDVIQLAVLEGIIVVAAAGNGNFDLDTYTNATGLHIFNRNSPDSRDSGAILVGACDSSIVHDRLPASNYGSRVDCYSWGRLVTTTGHNGDLHNGGGNANAAYTRTFNGTSSAAPIIAGAAMILQGMYKARTGSVISPLDMRTILANPATGTPHGRNVTGDFGVMPDLKAIITSNPMFGCCHTQICPPRCRAGILPAISDRIHGVISRRRQ